MLTFNRKLLLTLTSIIAITIMPACKHDSKEINELLKIEKLNESDPKAALELIDSIQPEKYNTPKLKALYSLVKSQALDKNLILLNSDSIISVARQYYEDSPDKYHRMKSEYYYGMINLNSEKLDTALLAFLKAYDLGEEIKDYFWQGMSASKMTDIFTRNYDGQQALEFAKISLSCLRKAGKSEYVNYALLDLATTYHNIDYSDSCINIVRNLLENNSMISDPWFECEAKELLAIAYIQKEEYAKALKTLNEISRPDGNESVKKAYEALAYSKLGNTKRGIAIINCLSDSNSIISDYLKYELYDELNYQNEAFKLLKLLYEESDEKLRKNFTSNISVTLLKYNITEQQLQKANIAKYRYRAIYIATASILVILIVIMAFFNYSKKQKIKNQELVDSAKTLNDRLFDITQNNKRLANSIYSLLSTQFTGVNEACQTLYEHENVDKAKKKIAQNMLKLIHSISEDNETIHELEKLLDHHCNHVFSKFKSDFQDMKNDDYRLFLYSALGFDNVAISKFFNTTVKGVYGRRDRIKNRILGSDTENKDKYIAILYPQGLKHKYEGNIGENQKLYRPNIKISD